MPHESVIFDDSELLHLVLDSATDFAIFTMDERGIVTSWNAGAERLTGHAAADMLGKKADILFTQEERAAGVPDLERETAARQGRADDERWHVRKDGSRFWGNGVVMALKGQSGFLKILRDQTERQKAFENLLASEARFRELATSIPQLVFRTKASGERTWASPQWEVFTGLPDHLSRDFGWVDAIHDDDRAATLEGWRDAHENGLYDVEHRIRRSGDGEFRWHRTLARPARPASGLVEEWVGTSMDVHDLKMMNERQGILVHELQHRTRNLMTLIRAVARQTARMSGELEDFDREFGSRLESLARVQSYLAETNHGSILLRAILEGELTAHAGEGGRTRIDGPDVRLPPSTAQILALALHELATNALKYGALHHPGGTLSVTWRITRHDGAHGVVLDWTETGVPSSQGPPSRKGYGSELIERALPYQLRATTRMAFGPDGLHCFIFVPLAETGSHA